MGAEHPAANRGTSHDREPTEQRHQRHDEHKEYSKDPAGFLQHAEEQLNRMDESDVPQLIENLRSMGFRLESRVRDNVSPNDARFHKLTYTFKKAPEQRGMPEITVTMEVQYNSYVLTVFARGDNYERTFYGDALPAENIQRKLRHIEQTVEFDTRLSRETGFYFGNYSGDRGVFYVRDGSGNIPELLLEIQPQPYFFEGQEDIEISIGVPSGSDSEWAHFPNPERFNFRTTINGNDPHTQILQVIHDYIRRILNQSR